MTATACLPTMQNLLPSLFAPEYWASEDVLRNPWQETLHHAPVKGASSCILTMHGGFSPPSSRRTNCMETSFSPSLRRSMSREAHGESTTQERAYYFARPLGG